MRMHIAMTLVLTAVATATAMGQTTRQAADSNAAVSALVEYYKTATISFVEANEAQKAEHRKQLDALRAKLPATLTLIRTLGQMHVGPRDGNYRSFFLGGFTAGKDTFGFRPVIFDIKSMPDNFRTGQTVIITGTPVIVEDTSFNGDDGARYRTTAGARIIIALRGWCYLILKDATCTVEGKTATPLPAEFPPMTKEQIKARNAARSATTQKAK